MAKLVGARWMLAAAIVLSGCGPIGVSTSGPVQKHPLQGVVLSVDRNAKTATVKHGNVPGFMGPMTMEYPIRNAEELNSLRVGESIDAEVFVRDADYWLGEITERKAGSTK